MRPTELSSTSAWNPFTSNNPADRELEAICADRRAAFSELWHRWGLVTVYAPAERMHKILGKSEDGTSHFGVKSALPSFNPDDVLVVTHQGSDPRPSRSLWVRNEYSGYLRAFMSFLREHHGYRGGSSLAAIGYDVDHLRNKARTPDGTYIRVEPVASAANRRWGSTFERAASHPGFTRKKPMGTVDWFIAAKFQGVFPPRSPRDKAGLKRLGLLKV
ncbi:hypothetical protein [Pseudarthrobacter sp. ATCC 49987]|uniref:hypothetical protein n=1 Tax=Pseudarthrobacter sp. ATCC 49987 TaxID=2698204 RepID=UPI00136FAA66|nr:hypothetical protein [Pseudarthrobacter sp. ATCC 49987]